MHHRVEKQRNNRGLTALRSLMSFHQLSSALGLPSSPPELETPAVSGAESGPTPGVSVRSKESRTRKSKTIMLIYAGVFQIRWLFSRSHGLPPPSYEGRGMLLGAFVVVCAQAEKHTPVGFARFHDHAGRQVLSCLVN